MHEDDGDGFLDPTSKEVETLFAIAAAHSESDKGRGNIVKNTEVEEERGESKRQHHKIQATGYFQGPGVTASD